MRASYRIAMAGVAALALLGAGCSSGSSSSSGGTDWATVTSASAGGGMNALVAAAKKEGTLNVIALPPTWANYGNIIKTFSQKYGIKINSANPDGTSQQEVNAIKQESGTAATDAVVPGDGLGKACPDVVSALGLVEAGVDEAFGLRCEVEELEPQATRVNAATMARPWESLLKRPGF